MTRVYMLNYQEGSVVFHLIICVRQTLFSRGEWFQIPYMFHLELGTYPWEHVYYFFKSEIYSIYFGTWNPEPVTDSKDDSRIYVGSTCIIN